MSQIKTKQSVYSLLNFQIIQYTLKITRSPSYQKWGGQCRQVDKRIFLCQTNLKMASEPFLNIPNWTLKCLYNLDVEKQRLKQLSEKSQIPIPVRVRKGTGQTQYYPQDKQSKWFSSFRFQSNWSCRTICCAQLCNSNHTTDIKATAHHEGKMFILS